MNTKSTSKRQQVSNEDNPPEKKQKFTDFTEQGRYTDEVALKFCDGTTFYASSSFLKMASPVFQACLESDFVERQSGEIDFKTKDSTTFLMLLKCLHPYIRMPITEESAFSILPLAEEYLMNAIIAECKNFIPIIFGRAEELIKKLDFKDTSFYYSKRIDESGYNTILRCFLILSCSVTYGHDDKIKIRAMELLSRIPSELYVKDIPGTPKHYKQFSAVYKMLPLNVQVELLTKRLSVTDFHLRYSF